MICCINSIHLLRYHDLLSVKHAPYAGTDGTAVPFPIHMEHVSFLIFAVFMPLCLPEALLFHHRGKAVKYTKPRQVQQWYK